MITTLVAACLIGPIAMVNDNDLLDKNRVWIALAKPKRIDALPGIGRGKRLGVIEKQEEWDSFWQDYKPGTDIPPVNFHTEVVVVIRNVRFLNRIQVTAVERSGGRVTVTAAETRSARPIRDRCYCALVVISRVGIKEVTDGRSRIVLKKLPELNGN